MRVAAYRISLLFAVSVALATFGGAALVLVLRPLTRRRPLPFYSDATHSDPERTLLSLCENFALALLPLVGCFERAQHERLLGTPLPLVAVVNSWATVGTFVCFWVTANTPTVMPWTPLHQVFASSLMVAYAIQATAKARIARRLGLRTDFRTAIAVVLWGTILATFLSFAMLQIFGPPMRYLAHTFMAAAVHLATAACVALMGVLASDLRTESVVFQSHGPSTAEKNIPH